MEHDINSLRHENFNQPSTFIKASGNNIKNMAITEALVLV